MARRGADADSDSEDYVRLGTPLESAAAGGFAAAKQDPAATRALPVRAPSTCCQGGGSCAALRGSRCGAG